MMSNTFLENIKIDQKETVMANILAYYFDPKGDHGLGSLFIEAFFRTKSYKLETYEFDELDNRFCAPDIIPSKLNECKVFTELKTGIDKRIDILIKNKEFALCIEFKINHILNNDLENYKERTNLTYYEEIKNGKKAQTLINNSYFAILTPEWKRPIGQKKGSPEESKYTGPKREFKQVILQHFISTVESLRKTRGIVPKGNDQYFYQDFIQTIRNRRKGLDAYLNFDEKISSNDERALVKHFIKDKVQKLYEYINDSTIDFKEKKGELESVISINTNKSIRKVRLTTVGWKLEEWKNKTSNVIQTLAMDTCFEELKNCLLDRKQNEFTQ